jgi:Salmonella virulence plasmid 65kDa B protein
MKARDNSGGGQPFAAAGIGTLLTAPPAERFARSGSRPSITLPKGGGAIRGLGKKFSANPTTGSGSLTVPIAASPGRSAFGPRLAISYDSGSGNGIFSFGWGLSLSSISRKTDKGLTILSLGFAPRPSVQTYSIEQPPLPFPLSSVPGLDQRLYGHPESTAAGVYFGASWYQPFSWP